MFVIDLAAMRGVGAVTNEEAVHRTDSRPTRET
jgi:hypothetical protein